MGAVASTDMDEVDKERDIVSTIIETWADPAKPTVDVAGSSALFEEAVEQHVYKDSDESAQELVGLNTLDCHENNMFDDDNFEGDELCKLFECEENFLDENFDHDDLPSLFDFSTSCKYTTIIYDEHFEQDDLQSLFDCSKTSKYVNATGSAENESRNTERFIDTESDSEDDYLHLFSDDEDDSKNVKSYSDSSTTRISKPNKTQKQSSKCKSNKPKQSHAQSKTKVERKYTTLDKRDYYDAELISRINSVVFRCTSTNTVTSVDCDMGAQWTTPPLGQTRARAEEEDDTCCICLDSHNDPTVLPKCLHKFCKECIERQFRIKPVCPVCFTPYGIITGIQPPGKMGYSVNRDMHLPGYKSSDTIVITYSFPNGTQTAEHPHPGVSYSGTSRAAYLPDNEEGRKVLRLLEESFRRRLTFTIGRSRTTGAENTVTWNDIHHKTSPSGGMEYFGYPDPTYLSRVQEELAAVGVTEESLNAFSESMDFE